jgi:hypothetical protein
MRSGSSTLVLITAGLIAVRNRKHIGLEADHACGPDPIAEAAAEVAAELKQQYKLGYRPTNRRHDGAFRQIKVELLDKSLRGRMKNLNR